MEGLAGRSLGTYVYHNGTFQEYVNSTVNLMLGEVKERRWMWVRQHRMPREKAKDGF